MQPPVKRATMADVARVARVATKTVSRVLNNEQSVAPETAKRVIEAISLLGFKRNLNGIALRRGSTATIGLVVDSLADPFFSAVSAAVEDATASSEILVLSASTNADPARQREVITRLLGRRVDGLILAPCGDEYDLRTDIRQGTAVVCVDRLPTGIDVDVVRSDNLGGAIAGVTELLNSGCRSIAFIGAAEDFGGNHHERLQGYRQAHRSASVLVDESIVVTNMNGPEDAEAAVARLLRASRPIDAIFAANNRMMAGALRAVRRLDPRPAGLRLLGFGDLELAELMEPSFDSVAQDPALIGRTAAQMLMERINGGDQPPRIVNTPTHFIRR